MGFQVEVELGKKLHKSSHLKMYKYQNPSRYLNNNLDKVGSGNWCLLLTQQLGRRCCEENLFVINQALKK